MSKTWKDLLQEMETGQPPQNLREWIMSSEGYPLGKKVRLYLDEQTLETVATCVEDIVQLCKNVPQIADSVFFSVLQVLLYKLSPERRFVLVRVCVRHLAETISSPEPLEGERPSWVDLWTFFAANKIAIKNVVQLRQLRSLARKAYAKHPRFLIFAYEQFVFISDRMRMSRLERFQYFREVRKPKWLHS
jgi:hypothetical protein